MDRRRSTSDQRLPVLDFGSIAHSAVFGATKLSQVLAGLLMHRAWTKCSGCTRSIARQQHYHKPSGAMEKLKEHAASCSKAVEVAMQKLSCVVCKELKGRVDYRNNIWKGRTKNRLEHHMCKACFVCPTCSPRARHKLVDFVHGHFAKCALQH